MPGTHRLRLTFLLCCVLTLPVACLAQAATDYALTNADIAKMAKAGLPESIILREIQISRNAFSTSPAALIQLKKQGASERILGAILDSQGGGPGYTGPGYASEPPANVDITAQSAALRMHHMPSFEADVRVNAKTHEKVSVGQNHIKVEQSGVPVFSLNWKDPNSK